VRIAGCDTDYGDATATREPRFPAHFLSGAIQYHQQRKHFRYVRVNFGRATVIGIEPTAKNKETATKDEMLNENGWRNYIYAYTLGKDKIADVYTGRLPMLLKPDNYNKGLYGGADEWRVAHWNIRTANNQKTKTSKKNMLNEIKPLIIMLNEPRRQM
jgi:hypothetical protein